MMPLFTLFAFLLALERTGNPQDKQEEDIRKWSFYEVYLTNRAVKSAREEYGDLDNIVADQIQNNRVGTAQQFRTMIGEVAKNKKLISTSTNQRIAALSLRVCLI